MAATAAMQASIKVMIFILSAALSQKRAAKGCARVGYVSVQRELWKGFIGAVKL